MALGLAVSREVLTDLRNRQMGKRSSLSHTVEGLKGRVCLASDEWSVFDVLWR
jgi:hypothetical protein